MHAICLRLKRQWMNLIFKSCQDIWFNWLVLCGGKPEHLSSTWPPLRTFHVFPGEGVHNEELVKRVQKLQLFGYRDDFSVEVFNDAYINLPMSIVARWAIRRVEFLSEGVSRRSSHCRT